VEQELLFLPEHLSSPPVFSGVRVTRSLVLYVCFVDLCLSFCTYFFWALYCLFLFDIRILITPLVVVVVWGFNVRLTYWGIADNLVSSNSSLYHFIVCNVNQMKNKICTLCTVQKSLTHIYKTAHLIHAFHINSSKDLS
jgi:hypothetical protein